MTQLSIENVAASYAERGALAGISADIPAGTLVALVGPNGAGKSTLLRVIAGLLEPTAGQVIVDGGSVDALSASERARRIAYLPPDGRSAWPMPARRIVALGRAPFLKPLQALGPDDEAAIDAAMARAGVEHLAGRAFDTLSSGERARVLIARVLAARAEIILLDEPTAALDPRHQLAVMEIARAEAERGAIVIASIHALDLAAKYADRIIVLNGGEVCADGTPTDVLTPVTMLDVFGVGAPAGVQPVDWILTG